MKRCVASLLVIMILASNFCYAMPLLKKKETVYVNLQGYGDVSEINIYNKWNLKRKRQKKRNSP